MTDGVFRPLRIGIVGCGAIAVRSHLPAFQAMAGVTVVAACSGHRETAEATVKRFAIPRVHDRWQELVADPEVDAVAVCTPNALHAPVSIAASTNGKHVLVEKPMAVDLEQAGVMIDAARRAGTILMVAQNIRFLPASVEAQRLLRSGVIGRINTVRGTFMHAGPDSFWKATSSWFWEESQAGGGALLDLGIHSVDLMRWLAGQEIVEVSAMAARREKPTFADDNAIALLRFADGALGSVQASWTARPVPERTMTVHGDRGVLTLTGLPERPLLLHVEGDDVSGEQALTVPAQTELGSVFEHFVRAVRGEVEPIIDGEECRRSLAVVLAAYESARTGRTVSVRVG